MDQHWRERAMRILWLQLFPSVRGRRWNDIICIVKLSTKTGVAPAENTICFLQFHSLLYTRV